MLLVEMCFINYFLFAFLYYISICENNIEEEIIMIVSSKLVQYDY